VHVLFMDESLGVDVDVTGMREVLVFIVVWVFFMVSLEENGAVLLMSGGDQSEPIVGSCHYLTFLVDFCLAFLEACLQYFLSHCWPGVS